MKGILKIFGIIVGAILLIFSLAFLTGNMNLFFSDYFGTRQQQIETNIYKETEMYNEAKVQQLSKMKYEHTLADSTGKAAIESMIRHRYADYEANKLPKELGEFLIKIRSK